jgi:hypothetical protein
MTMNSFKVQITKPENARLKRKKWIINVVSFSFSNQIEEFERFVDQLESDYLQMSTDPKSWNTTVGTLYRESYRVFLNVRLKVLNSGNPQF